MNFLQLCQAFRQEAGISGSGPTTVVGQSGEYKRIVDWIARAWVKIQTDKGRKWKFTWTQVEINTTADVQTYDMSGESIKEIDTDTFTIFLTSATQSAEQKLAYMEYSKWRKINGHQHPDSSFPSVVTVLPDGDLKFYPPPDADYTVRFDGRFAVQHMTADSDTPYLPADYHHAILYQALLDYGRYEGAEEIIQVVPAQWEDAYNSLLWEQLDRPEELVVRVE